jgi:hypothetical protein
MSSSVRGGSLRLPKYSRFHVPRRRGLRPGLLTAACSAVSPRGTAVGLHGPERFFPARRPLAGRFVISLALRGLALGDLLVGQRFLRTQFLGQLDVPREPTPWTPRFDNAVGHDIVALLLTQKVDFHPGRKTAHAFVVRHTEALDHIKNPLGREARLELWRRLGDRRRDWRRLDRRRLRRRHPLVILITQIPQTEENQQKEKLIQRKGGCRNPHHCSETDKPGQSHKLTRNSPVATRPVLPRLRPPPKLYPHSHADTWTFCQMSMCQRML